MEDVLNVIGKLALYLVTILCGLLIHSLVLLPLVFFVITRSNPYRFMKGVGDALMTAFGIASRFVSCICEHMHVKIMQSNYLKRVFKRCDPFNQNSNRSDREKLSTSKGGPVFSKLFRLDRTDPLSFGPKFPEIVVEYGSRPRGLYSPRNDTTIRPRNDSVKGIPLFYVNSVLKSVLSTFG